jgi:hypothetical protein
MITKEMINEAQKTGISRADVSWLKKKGRTISDVVDGHPGLALWLMKELPLIFPLTDAQVIVACALAPTQIEFAGERLMAAISNWFGLAVKQDAPMPGRDHE